MVEAVEIPKNASETLRVERTEYMGKDLVAVRVFTGRPGETGAKPTRKGLTLRPDTWRELLPALMAALEEGDHGKRHGLSGESEEEPAE